MSLRQKFDSATVNMNFTSPHRTISKIAAPPAPRIVGVTTADLAKQCQVPETSLVRTLRRVGINPDIRVGLRTAYSKPLADAITSWATSMICANTARIVAEDDRMLGCQGPKAEARARAAEAALTFQSHANEKLARILRRQTNPKHL